jgi:threonine synthase
VIPPAAHPWRGVIEEYRERLPIGASTPVVTLREGGTPLVRSSSLSDETDADVWLKYEGSNPTGSFKDRGMTVAISKAVEGGSKAVVCASTGNTSASAAAYAAKAGMTCAVLVPKGKVALGKMAQTLVHGARVLEVDANFDASLELAKALSERYPVTLVNSVNPYRLQGQKTCAFEICDALGRPPDLHLVPVGNAGTSRATGSAIGSISTTERSRIRPRCSASRRAARRRSCSAGRSPIHRRSRPRSGSGTPRPGIGR